MICPSCEIKMVRRKSKFGGGYWWGCPNYPECRVTSAEHPDGSMMSTPANQEIKDLRKEAHRLAAEIWGDWESPKCRKSEMYDWLKYNTKSGHFGMMEKEELVRTIEKLKTTIQWKAVK